MRPLLAVPLLALLAACSDAVPLRPITPAPTPTRTPPFLSPGVPDEPAPPTPATPLSGCPEVVVEGRGYIIDLAFLGDRLVLGTSTGLLLQAPSGGFTTLDPDPAWRVRVLADGAIYAETSTAALWDSFSLVRFDLEGVRTVLLDPDDLRDLAALHAPPSSDGSVAHAVVADFALLGDRLVFSADDLALVDHLAVGLAGGNAGHLFSLPADGSGTATTHAAFAVAGELSVDAARGEIYLAGVTIDRHDLLGLSATIFDNFDVSPQRLTATENVLFVTSGANGAVVAVDKQSYAVRAFDMSAAHWDVDVAVAGDYLYWLERDFLPDFTVGRVRRAPLAGGEPELVSDCVSSPSRMMAHDGALWIASESDAGGVLSRLPLPE